jgi:fumarylacetoacetase
MILDIPKDSDFSLYNIPFGIVSRPNGEPRPATAIGDFALDLSILADADMFNGPLLSKVAKQVFNKVTKFFP